MAPRYRIMANNWNATMSKSWNEATVADRPDHINVYINSFGPIPDNHHIHHIDNNHENNDPSNLIALPRVLHRNIHSNYSFYYNLATSGKINKELLQSVFKYYKVMKYSMSKKFSTVFVEYLLSEYKPNLKLEVPQAVSVTPSVELLKRVRGVLAPFHKQNDLFFGAGGIYKKLSPVQVEKSLQKVLKTVSELYFEIKEAQP